jgi:hypothetical protein
MRLVGFFQKPDFLRAQLKIYGVYRAIDVIFFVAPTTGDVTFVSSQASEISVMDT